MPIRAVSADALRSCERCQERFGRLESLRAPIPLRCRHVICIGCLRDDGSSCPICGAAYSKERFQSLFDLVATSPHYTPLPLEAEDTDRVLRNRCLSLNETTPLSILRDVLRACNHFLEDQPRNQFTELENSARFLSYRIKAEETIEAMAFSMECLAGTVQHLNQRLEEEKESRSNDRALSDQQLNEANTRELDLLSRIARLEMDLEQTISDHALSAEQRPLSIPSETPPRPEGPAVNAAGVYSDFDSISRPLSPLPIGSMPQGFGAIGALQMRSLMVLTGGDQWDERLSHGHLYSGNNVSTRALTPSTTANNIGHFPYSTTSLFHEPAPNNSGRSLIPMTAVVPPTIRPRQIWLSLEGSDPTLPHQLVDGEEDHDEYFDLVEDESEPEFQPSP